MWVVFRQKSPLNRYNNGRGNEKRLQRFLSKNGQLSLISGCIVETSLRVFLSEQLHQHMWVIGGIYSVGTESVYQIGQSGKTECFVSVSQEGLTCELLAKHSCLHPVLTLCIPIMLSSELLAKTFQSSICLSLHTLSLSHITLTIKSHNKYRV